MRAGCAATIAVVSAFLYQGQGRAQSGGAQEAAVGARVSGLVTDTTGAIMPAATVVAEGADSRDLAVTDERGAWVLEHLAPGAYLVTAELPGFRGTPRRVSVGEVEVRVPPLQLQVNPLQFHVNRPVPLPEAYRSIDAVAHVRIERTQPPVRCGDDLIFGTFHLARVLAIAKGRLPLTLWLQEGDAGTCISGVEQFHLGPQWPVGRELMVFLSRNNDEFYAHPALVVESGRLTGDVAEPLRVGMGVAEAFAALKRAAERGR